MKKRKDPSKTPMLKTSFTLGGVCLVYEIDKLCQMISRSIKRLNRHTATPAHPTCSTLALQNELETHRHGSSLCTTNK